MTSQVNFSDRLKKILEHVFSNVLLPFQTQAVCDPANFKIINKARQIGFSEFVLAFGGWLHIFNGEPVYFVSRTQPQSIYLMDKFYRWGKYFQACGLPLKWEYESKKEARIFGVDIKALSSNAAGDEGYTGHVKLDEFALFQNDEGIYRSVVPTVSTGFSLTICSRPFGQSNLHYGLFTDTDRYPNLSRHQVTIYDAVNQGFNVDIKDIAGKFGGEGSEAFRELYCCEFVDESTAFLPYKLIRDCIGDEISGEGEYFIGVDVGRKKDFTVVIVGKKIGEIVYVKEPYVMRNQPYHIQKQYIIDLCRSLKARAGLIDETGLGNNLAEDIHRECYQIEGLSFTSQAKEEMGFGLKAILESKRIVIPESAEYVSDLHSVQRSATSSNRVKLDAPHTGDGEHGNRFWATALMIRSASGITPQIVKPTPIYREAQKLTRNYI